jgi:hypothetical protein
LATRRTTLVILSCHCIPNRSSRTCCAAS